MPSLSFTAQYWSSVTPSNFSTMPYATSVSSAVGVSREFAVSGPADDADASNPEGDLDLDLHCAATGQRGDADRGAAVTPGITEHVEQQPARAVDHRGLLLETRRARDE